MLLTTTYTCGYCKQIIRFGNQSFHSAGCLTMNPGQRRAEPAIEYITPGWAKLFSCGIFPSVCDIHRDKL